MKFLVFWINNFILKIIFKNNPNNQEFGRSTRARRIFYNLKRNISIGRVWVAYVPRKILTNQLNAFRRPCRMCYVKWNRPLILKRD